MKIPVITLTGTKPLKYKLCEDYTYHSDRYDIDIHIPAGYTWDGSTFAYDVYPYIASMIHDWCYDGHPADVSRLMADMIYYDILLQCSTPWICASVRFLVLRLVSWQFW